MADEKKEEVKAGKEEKPKKKAPAIKVHKAKRVKLSKLSLAEVNKALEEVQVKMGGFHSSYAQSLLGQKKRLENMSQQSVQKKAA